MTDRPLPPVNDEDVQYIRLALELGVPIYYDYCPVGTSSRYSLYFQPLEAIRHVRGYIEDPSHFVLVSLINFKTCYTFDLLHGQYFHPNYVQEKLIGTLEYDAECLAHLLNEIRTALQ